MSILGVMGPVMIGPSSSHTAGAVRLGRLARLTYGRPVRSVHIALLNSFAETGKGHGTDKAVVGGLLGMEVDDERLKDALEIAAGQGAQVSFAHLNDAEKPPNYVEISFRPGEREWEEPFTVAGVSLGGGSVSIVNINGYEAGFSGRYDVLLLAYADVPGMVGFIGETLGSKQINIAHLRISRDSETGAAVALLKLDSPCTPEVLSELEGNPGISRVTYIPKQDGTYDGTEED